jgi:transcriptional regulator with XRE-family HTH domain
MNDKHREAGKLLLSFIRKIAKEKGMTEKDIALNSGFIQPNVNRMLSGKYMPSLDNFLKLGEAVGVRIELHSPEVPSAAKIRNLEIPRFMFSPDMQTKQLYIIHTHYPACVIHVIQTIPTSLEVLQNFDNCDDFEDVIEDALEFYRNNVMNDDEMMN